MQHSPGAVSRSGLLDQAEQILRHCEGDVQALMAEAAISGKYDEIDRLAAIARSLGEMANSAVSAQRIDWLVEDGARSHPVAAGGGPRGARMATSTKRYPLFLRDGHDLVKIGWSKKKNEEYVHRARRGRVEAIVLLLAEQGRGRVLLSKDDILGIRDGSGAEIPSYQVYLTLGWLRKEALVERRGRDGYVVPNAEKLEATFEDFWGALPEYERP